MWDEDENRRPHPRFAGDPHHSTVCLGYFLDQCKAKSTASNCSGTCRVDPIESLEDMRQVPLVYANPRVAHREYRHRYFLVMAQAYFDAPTIDVIQYCIGEQIGDEFGELHRIPFDMDGLQLRFQKDSASTTQITNSVD